MKLRFTLFRRGEVYYCEDTTTRKQTTPVDVDAGDVEAVVLGITNNQWQNA
jgi:hypothetical protein